MSESEGGAVLDEPLAPDQPEEADDKPGGYRFLLMLAGFGTPVVLWAVWASTWWIAARSPGASVESNAFGWAPVALLMYGGIAALVLWATTGAGLVRSGAPGGRRLPPFLIAIETFVAVLLLFWVIPESGANDGYPTGAGITAVALVAALLVLVPSLALLVHGRGSLLARVSGPLKIASVVVVLTSFAGVVVGGALHQSEPLMWWSNEPKLEGQALGPCVSADQAGLLTLAREIGPEAAWDAPAMDQYATYCVTSGFVNEPMDKIAARVPTLLAAHGFSVGPATSFQFADTGWWATTADQKTVSVRLRRDSPKLTYVTVMSRSG